MDFRQTQFAVVRNHQTALGNVQFIACRPPEAFQIIIAIDDQCKITWPECTAGDRVQITQKLQ